MKGMRKTLLGFAYIFAMAGISALEIMKHSPADLTGLGTLAGGLAIGLGTVMWGNAQEHKAASGKTTP